MRPSFGSPLAELLRPTTLEHVVGQEHLIGPDGPLRHLIEQGSIYSLLFWGPPGVGKTTLARILAQASGRQFIELSAVSASKADIKEVVENAKNPQSSLLSQGKPPVLFLDEIHRFTKAQQDYLLPWVEDGTIVLIGATTENPSFEVIAPLLSRTRVFVLKELTLDHLHELIHKVATLLETTITEETAEAAVRLANGDARQLLTLFDHCWQTYHQISEDKLQKVSTTWLRYDQQGEQHYDTISAYIKSMRAGDANAALYYLARMVEAGEDPKFIARRMVIFASEDIGLAQPTALVVANAVFDAVSKIGYPECAINLAHGTAFLAQSKKDRRAYDALRAAQADTRRFGNLPIPLSLRNAPTDLMKELGYGKDYEMYPDPDTSLLPDQIKNKTYLPDT